MRLGRLGPRDLSLAVILFAVSNIADAAWESADVPNPLPEPGQAGSATESPAGTWTIRGSGGDIWNQSDEFHFLYEAAGTTETSMTLSCHVVSFTDTPSSWGKAGIMFRAGSPPFAGPEAYAFCAVTPENGVVFQWRDGANEFAAWGGEANQLLGVGPDDVYLKLVREGAIFYSYASRDRLAWISLGSYTFTGIAEDQELYVGIAVTSHDRTALSTLVVDQIGSPDMSLNGPVDLTCTVTETTVDMAWSNRAVYTEINVYREAAGTDSPQLLGTLPGTATRARDSPGDGIWTYYIVADERGAWTSAVSCSVNIGELGYVDARGFIHSWLMLGPLGQMGSSAPGVEAMRLDYLTDGVASFQELVMPRADDAVEPDYNRAAASTGLGSVANPPTNPKGIPQWAAWHSRDEAIDFEEESLFGPQDNAMAYAVAYLRVEEDMMVVAACGSDDSIQILVGDREVWINSIGRSWISGIPQDRSPPFLLRRGFNRLMVKVFEGSGAWRFGVRFEDELGTPITAGYQVCLDPVQCEGVVPARVAVFIGDVNADGRVNIADAIVVLGYVFGKPGAPGCLKSADANDDDDINIADAISILGFLFGHGLLTGPDGRGLTAVSNGCTPYPAEAVAELGGGCAEPCAP